MKKLKLFAALAVFLTGAVALAQEAMKMASPETPTAELVEIAQAAIAQDKIDNVTYAKNEAVEFQTIGEYIEAAIKSSDDVTDFRRAYPEKNGHQMGIAYRFKYLGRPIWAMFVEKDEHRGLDGERRLMVVAPGRAGKTTAEEFLLGLAPEVYHLELNRNVRRELENRFGVEWHYVTFQDTMNRIDAPMREVSPGKMERSAKPEIDRLLEICREIGEKYRLAQEPKPTK